MAFSFQVLLGNTSLDQVSGTLTNGSILPLPCSTEEGDDDSDGAARAQLLAIWIGVGLLVLSLIAGLWLRRRRKAMMRLPCSKGDALSSGDTSNTDSQTRVLNTGRFVSCPEHRTNFDNLDVVSLSMWSSSLMAASGVSPDNTTSSGAGGSTASPSSNGRSSTSGAEPNFRWVKQLQSNGVPVLPAGLLKYSPNDLIGKGSFADVYLADMSGVKVALKHVYLQRMQVSRSDPKEEGALETALREVMLLMRVSHPHLVRLLAVSVDPTKDTEMLLALEYCNHGDLADTLQHRPEVLHGQQQLSLQLLHDIAYGMSALHAVSIVHRDLKPANVMLCASPERGFVAKVSDFGLSCRTDSSVLSRVLKSGTSGTLLYMSPQRILQRLPASPACDVYAYGLVAYEVAHVTVSGQHVHPYSGYGVVDSESLVKTLAAGHGLALPDEFAPAGPLGRALRRTLIITPQEEERPTFSQLHEAFLAHSDHHPAGG
eukprot:CAMPEP_0183792484 /NCGR_PEP_ID=MMETSP0803_2-20130417/2604_1 /TAXON_ID=195967 /ORGANISM="Crustomastix stigmata, Strain CCMP3273" /LENGTH=484 /DNA_ID=CAMNT_0026036839 /DNA_START=435 /DNA_END=1886 /DNA_ORIENTATION=-